MNKTDLAKILNGREYGSEITETEEKQAKDNGLIVIFGYSDDNIELRGAIEDELPSYDGCEFIIAKPGAKVCTDEEGKAYEKITQLTAVVIDSRSATKRNRLEAVWCPNELVCSWLIKTDLPHAPFDIMEGHDLFCRGLVIDVNELEATT